MAQTTFDGPIISRNGNYNAGSGVVVPLTTSTSLTVADHAGRIITCGGTMTLTLPAVNASVYPSSSGPGADPNTLNNQGVTFTFFVKTTAVALVIRSATSADLMYGMLSSNISTAATGVVWFPNQSSNYIITMDGTTQGGIVGTYIQITSLYANAWLVEGHLKASGVQATPFSG